MTITPMMQYIQDKLYSIVCNNWVPISQEISMRDTKYYYPISLSRVLTALGESKSYSNWYILDRGRDWFCSYFKKVCKRKLLNEDWTDATLFDQSQETITAIWVLLWWKDE